MNDKRINLQYICYKIYVKKCNVYLVHTYVVQGCHPHWGQLVAIVSQAQLSIAIIAPAIHLRERTSCANCQWGEKSCPTQIRYSKPTLWVQGPTNARQMTEFVPIP